MLISFIITSFNTRFRLYELQHYHTRDARWTKIATHILSWVHRFHSEITTLKQIEKYTYGQDFILTARKFRTTGKFGI